MSTPITSAIKMANIKERLLRTTVNLVPNSFRSMGNVTTPTIVKVVRNATEGTIPTPEDTRVPTNGKAINAGTKVIVPTAAAITPAINIDCFPTYSAMVSGGKIDSSNPMAKTMERMENTRFFPIPRAIFRLLIVFFLSFIIEKTRKATVPTHRIIVNTSNSIPPYFVINGIFKHSITSCNRIIDTCVSFCYNISRQVSFYRRTPN